MSKATVIAHCAVNPSSSVGRSYDWAADVGGEKRVARSTDPTTHTFAGILETFEQVSPTLWRLSLVCGGIARVKLGGTFTRGTHSMLFKTDGNGKCVTAPFTTAGLALGFLIPEDNATLVDNGTCRAYIAPHYVAAS